MKVNLPTSALRWTVNPDRLDINALEAETATLTGRPGAVGQDRALSALELGLGIRQRGFNIFVVGASGTGRTSTVRTVLESQAEGEPVPGDVVLVYNFEDRDRPHAILLPPGAGPAVKKRYETLVESMLHDLEKAFEGESYSDRQSEIEQWHGEQCDAHLAPIETEAEAKGFILTRGQGTLTLGVADNSGNPLSEEAFDAMSAEERTAFEEKAEVLQSGLEDALRKIRSTEKETDEKVEALSKLTADGALAPLFDAAKESLAAYPKVVEHLEEARADVLQRLRRLSPDEVEDDGQGGAPAPHRSLRRRLLEEEIDLGHDEPALLRYRVNVLVTHDKTGGAPVVFETHPTTSNLLGRIVHQSRGGEATTDFTRIKAGALFQANGGYLVINARDLFREPTAWEGLKRALKNREIELDDPGEPGRMVTLASLRPAPVPLTLKVCLIGTPDLYYALARTDPDFNKLFKVKVDFDLEMERSEDRIASYLRFLVGLAHEEELLPLEPSGAARFIEHAARVSQNRGKLTTRFGWIADLVREASFYAAKSGAKRIAKAHVQGALYSRKEREGFLEQRMHEDIADGRVRVELEGAVVGQTNGLTVLDLGSYQFGTPARITCRVGAGKGELVDIERETELGGPIHTKGTLIVRGILLDRFGSSGPLRMSATICIEQSYSDIDGDSASLAETCTLLSALSGIPLRQDFALTGSIDQRGQVQAVGGVNEKIEGFFRVTRARGANHSAAVIIPESNRDDLMLDEDVVAAQAAGTFAVHTVQTLEDAIELLTGHAYSGSPDAIYERCAARLAEFSNLVRDAYETRPKPAPKNGAGRVAAKEATGG